MFREGRNVQKKKRWCEEIHQNFHRFFIDFSWKFDAKSYKNHGKRLCAQTSTKNPRLERLLLANNRFFVDFWIPGELLGRPGSLAEASHFFIKFRLPLEIGPDRSLGGPREVQGVPQALPAQHFESILDRFSKLISTLAILEIYWIFAWSFCFCAFFLNLSFMRVTLIRATEKLYWT